MLEHTYLEMFRELSSLNDFELACRYKKVWFDVNVLELHNLLGSDYSMEEDILLNDLICSRFCNMVGLPVRLSCVNELIYYDWFE